MNQSKLSNVFTLLAVGGLMFATTSCDNAIYDYEGDCSTSYQVRFKYDHNMKYADAFPNEVNSVTLHLLDENDNVVWKKTESGAALAAEGYTMTVDAPAGTYHLLAWCGDEDATTYTIGTDSRKEGLTATLHRSYETRSDAHIRTRVNRLYHGYVESQTFPETEGTHTFTVPLVKNTNDIRVVLQQTSDKPLDKDLFSFEITDDNGLMEWDNAVTRTEILTYHPAWVDNGSAEIEGEQDSRAQSLNAVIAEFTTGRLMEDHRSDARLTVRRTDTGATVLSVRLIDVLLLVKGHYNGMSDQEYLDRQDDYSIVFFLSDNMAWMNSYIYINSWKVVLQSSDL